MLKSKSAGGVIIGPDNKVLIVSQKGLSWSLPKGHIEDNENLLDAAYREIEEETGITNLQYIKYLGNYTRFKMNKDNEDDKSEEKNIHFFLFRTEESEINPQDVDNPEGKWCDPQEVVSYLSHQKDKDFFNQIRPSILPLALGFIDIRCTTESLDEAKKISKSLIESRLAACCTITSKSESHYIWEDTYHEEEEYKLHIKSLKSLFTNVESHIRAMHSYDCPQIIATDIVAANDDYVHWAISEINKR